MSQVPQRLSLATAFSSLCALLLAAPASAQSESRGPTSNRLLDKLVSFHSTGFAGPFVSSPQGAVLFVAEGGSLGVIDDTTDQAKWNQIPKLLPLGNPTPQSGVGGPGVLPLALALDPAATSPYDRLDPTHPASTNDVLYIAAGRMGLWVADADQFSNHAVLRVARIDDAPALDNTRQTSRRWCCDVDFVTLGGITYVLALCSAKDDTKVRVFKISDARSVLNAHLLDQVGHELVPWKNIPVGRRPTLPAYPAERSRSFGYSMTIDPIDDQTAYLVVALGEQGLARLLLTSANMADQFTWLASNTQWGPMFGDGTSYASLNPLYDNLHYRALDVLSGTCKEPGVDRPFFVDVVVQNDSAINGDPARHFLYAAVDHLGWVQFDLSPGHAWNKDTPIAHHEGIPMHMETRCGVVGDQIVGLATDGHDQPVRTYCRRLAITHKDGKTLLVATCQAQPMAQDPGFRNEGQVLAWDLRSINGLGDVGSNGPSPHTLIYDLGDLGASLALSRHFQAASGGEHLFVFPRQAVAQGELEYFVGNSTQMTLFVDEQINGPSAPNNIPNSTSRYKVRYAPENQEVLEVRSRSKEHRPGRNTHVVGHFHDKPDLLVLGFNDCCVDDDGVTATCGTVIEHNYLPLSGPDTNGGFGIYFDPDAQWPNTDSSCAGGGAWVFGGRSIDWRLSRYCFGTEICPFQNPDNGFDPIETDFWLMKGTPDRLGQDGAGYLQASLDPLYDQENDQHWPMAFAVRGIAESGLIVLRRDALQTFAETTNLGTFRMGVDADAEISMLVTHPEYSNVDENDVHGDHFLNRPKSGILGSCSTWGPCLFKLPSSVGGPADTWVMAVPCGSVYYPPSVIQRYHDSFGLDWGPAPPYDTSHGKHLIRFWNIQDPALLDQDNPNHELSPFQEIIGPDAESNVLMCKAAQQGRKTLLFVADHAGRVYAYDVTNYLAGGGATSPLAMWRAPGSISDDSNNNIRSIAVDHATWTSSDGSHDEIYVYASVWRAGIQVLRFSWGPPPQLQPIELIQTPAYADWIHIRKTPQGTSLLVADTPGLRVYTYNF